ncbi:MAG: ActD-like protein [Myxococcales bacterium]|nr:ActD-like protein [Myxococcales bacterium]
MHLEQLARGELTPGRRAAVLADLGPDADARLAALAASDAQILAAHPPPAIAAAVQRRLDARVPRRARVLRYAGPALACAAVALLVLRPGDSDDPRAPTTTGPAPIDPPEGVRIKGLEPRLVLHRQAGAAAVELTSPARAHARDVLQVSYIAAGAAHGVILSLDGDGLVTLHHPAGIADTTALRQDGAVRLPQAYELDDAPRFERFVFITADAPLAVVDLMTAARELAGGPDPAHAPLALPTGARQTSFLVEKPTR